jgi:hypothetical protein
MLIVLCILRLPSNGKALDTNRFVLNIKPVLVAQELDHGLKNGDN